MKIKTILLTGANGFIGSHVAEHLIKNGFQIIALVRAESDLSLCRDFIKDLVLLDFNSQDLQKSISEYKPTCLIHAAWEGVSTVQRNDWNIQVKNVTLTTKLLTLANTSGVKKIIAFGSQAEYGNFNGRISENYPAKPNAAYGSVKIAAFQILKTFCELNNLKYYWLRLFSLYGSREKEEWLIPSVIRNACNNIQMDLTACDQYYDYLYIKEFCRAIKLAIESESESGIFNIGSDTSIKIKDLVESIRKKINPTVQFNYGKLPYRPGQNMHIEGDSGKFYKQFNFEPHTDLDHNLDEILPYYIKKYSK